MAGTVKTKQDMENAFSALKKAAEAELAQWSEDPTDKVSLVQARLETAKAAAAYVATADSLGETVSDSIRTLAGSADLSRSKAAVDSICSTVSGMDKKTLAAYVRKLLSVDPPAKAAASSGVTAGSSTPRGRVDTPTSVPVSKDKETTGRVDTPTSVPVSKDKETTGRVDTPTSVPVSKDKETTDGTGSSTTRPNNSAVRPELSTTPTRPNNSAVRPDPPTSRETDSDEAPTLEGIAKKLDALDGKIEQLMEMVDAIRRSS